MKKNLSVLIIVVAILYIAFVCFYYATSKNVHSTYLSKNQNVASSSILDAKSEDSSISGNEETQSQDTQIEIDDGYNYYIEFKDLGTGKKYRQVDINDINAVNIAVKKYQEEYNNKKGTESAVRGFLEFLPFYYAFLSGQSGIITDEANKIIDGQVEMPKYENGETPNIEDYLREKYGKYGINTNHDEGYFFATINYQYLYDNIASYLTAEWQELIKFNIKYQGTIISDAHFTIRKENIKEIISFYEDFKLKYPEFCEKHLNIDKVISTYKQGLNNYPCAAY